MDDVVLIGASCRRYPLIEPIVWIAKPALQLIMILETVSFSELIIIGEVFVPFSLDVSADRLADEVDGLLILGNPAFPV